MCNRDDATHRECITWSVDNTSFWVSNIEQFSRMILPMYFKHNNYASFVRQLNMYGFHRSTEPRGKVEPGSSMIEHFTHEFFVKGREDLLANIHRKTSSNFTKTSKRDRDTRARTPVTAAVKEAKHVQQQISDAEDARLRMQEDVDVLKKNQMQLANTIQVLHQQNVQLQREMVAQNERLESVIQVLTGHNVQVNVPNANVEALKRQRELSLDRDQAALQQQHQQQQVSQPLLQPQQSSASSSSQQPDSIDTDVYAIEEDSIDLNSMDLDNLFNSAETPPLVPFNTEFGNKPW